MNINVSVPQNNDRDLSSRFQKRAGFPLIINQRRLFAHTSGALYWPLHQTLIFADLHLEKGSHFATRQIFLPPYDTSATLENISAIIATFSPKSVVALGDSFHDMGGPRRLSRADKETLAELTTRVEWHWVAGNHDPELPKHLGGNFTTEVRLGGLIFRHQPQCNAEAGEVAGHLHPCARIRGRGRTIRNRCFIANQNRAILPAFGAFTGGLNVRDAAFMRLFPGGQYQAYLIGQKKLYPFASASCLPDLASPIKPKTYR